MCQSFVTTVPKGLRSSGDITFHFANLSPGICPVLQGYFYCQCPVKCATQIPSLYSKNYWRLIMQMRCKILDILSLIRSRLTWFCCYSHNLCSATGMLAHPVTSFRYKNSIIFFYTPMFNSECTICRIHRSAECVSL